MRLIDADVLIECIINRKFSREARWDDFEDLVDDIPTAYDAEAVVAELENFEMWKGLLIYDLSHRERGIIEKAISIVRGKE